MLNSIPISWLYILTVYIRVFNSFSFFCKQFDVIHVIEVVDFFPTIMKLVSASTFPKCEWLSGIIAITTNNDDRASPRKFPLWIFSSVKLFLPVSSSLVSHCIFDKLHDFTRYLVHLDTVYIPALCDYIICLFVVNLSHSKIFPSRFAVFEDVLINVYLLFSSLVPLAAYFLFLGEQLAVY